MINEPIKNPKKFGCGTCGNIPETILPENTHFFPSSVSILTIKIDDFIYEFEWLDSKYFDCDIPDHELVTLQKINEQFSDKLKDCKYAELTEMTPLHDETYEYNKDDGNWYLVKQGMGYA
jgi:hypothetical protein